MTEKIQLKSCPQIKRLFLCRYHFQSITSR